ncbi:hypothetical protein CDD81_7006 [Ophiocordyceps australis]|uniref:Protein BFR2 n=1 Tax=Ophiocordyceps australis TaxID=1399860 RepID=A0A2C5YHZ5_9HYPO|nr:hypothetical protein CDD81_7006 [Ophiocordyceps australis]
MAKTAGRALDFRNGDEHIVKDYDPDVDVPPSDQSSDSHASDDEDAATQHYIPVEKSRLRRSQGIGLGPEYSGSCVRRSALEEESQGQSQEDIDSDSMDQDDGDLDESMDDSDGVLSSNNATSARQRRVAADLMSMSADESMEDEDDNQEASQSDEAGDFDEDGQDDQEEEAEEGNKIRAGAQANSHWPHGDSVKTIPSGQTEVEKGVAIEKQRRMYDGLLNLRIRLQKALVAANTLPTVEHKPGHKPEPYNSAEEAAVKLLETLSSIRAKLGASKVAGIKRKRQADHDVSNEALWRQTQEQEQAASGFRRDRLDKWHGKVQSVNGAVAGTWQKYKTLVQALDSQLEDSKQRLVKRTRVPRSCAPCQAALKLAQDDEVFDDADFYQVLLKELVEERTVESAEAMRGALPSVMLTAAREAKTRKQVDRKASKGRKLRFTVHEKLQDFMACEDGRSWEQQAIDRFFGTLLGREMELDEDEQDEEEQGEEEAWTHVHGDKKNEICLFGH